MWKLLVGPLLELDIYGGVKGTRVHCLGSRQVDVLNHMGGNTFPQLPLQDGLPGRLKDKSCQLPITGLIEYILIAALFWSRLLYFGALCLLSIFYIHVNFFPPLDSDYYFLIQIYNRSNKQECL